eukprot:2478151-Prorocentrum_lima.AAC.1
MAEGSTQREMQSQGLQGQSSLGQRHHCSPTGDSLDRREGGDLGGAVPSSHIAAHARARRRKSMQRSRGNAGSQPHPHSKFH